MSRKGISLEEKRRRIEKYLHETNDFFQLKELEKIGPKLGVVQQSVKDVVQGLIDDGLVSTDKIATSNYYWAYPSAASQTKQRKLQELRSRIEHEQGKKKKLEEQVEIAQQGRQQSPERDRILAELNEAQNRQKALLAELQRYKDDDPEVYKAKEKGAAVAKEAANRWTENIWSMQAYCINKFGMDRAEFDRAFGIDSEFDTIQ